MLPFGAAVTYIYLHRGFLEELLPRLLLLSTFGALTCVPEGGEFQLTVGETCLRAQAGRWNGTHGWRMGWWNSVPEGGE